jgi:hypothetical protein
MSEAVESELRFGTMVVPDVCTFQKLVRAKNLRIPILLILVRLVRIHPLLQYNGNSANFVVHDVVLGLCDLLWIC